MLHVSSPETIFIKFYGLPKYFELCEADTGKVQYFRYLDGKTPRIKFNMPHVGNYIGNQPFEIIKRTSIKTPFNLPSLPSPDRNRVKEVTVNINDSLYGTPACIYTEVGEIEVDPSFWDYPKQIYDFLLFHEYAHLLYSNESDCDLFALVSCLRKGYNRSMCFYALSEILSDSEENRKRLNSLYKAIQYTQKESL